VNRIVLLFGMPDFNFEEMTLRDLFAGRKSKRKLAITWMPA